MKKNLGKLLDQLNDVYLNQQKLQYYRYISNLQEFLHQQIPVDNYNTDRMPVPPEIREEYFAGRNYHRAVMFFLSNGCEWALKDGHGCTMCGHLAKQTRRTEKISAEEFYHQFISEFRTIDFKKYPLLNLYNNGSLLNHNEMPEESRREILKMIGRHPDIKMLVLETRPEFVSQETIKEIKRLVPDKHVEIAIGLEIKDDFLRRVCVNKGFSLQQYTRAAEIITRQLHLRTYILLKPPFLTEKEAVTHAIETILYAFAVGSETVSLEACTIQDYTLVQYLAHQGLYKTPWLWSILEVVKSSFKRKFNRGKLVIGLFQFFPSPQEVPYNCDKCSSRVMEAIRCYNRTLDLSAFNQLNCLCKKEWEDEIKRKYPSFEKRLEHIIGQLNNDLENSTRDHGTGLKQCQGET